MMEIEPSRKENQIKDEIKQELQYYNVRKKTLMQIIEEDLMEYNYRPPRRWRRRNQIPTQKTYKKMWVKRSRRHQITEDQNPFLAGQKGFHWKPP